MTARHRFLVIGLLAAASLSAGACHKAKPAASPKAPETERRPYTPIPPPPTRTLKPGEPTPPPRLPE